MMHDGNARPRLDSVPPMPQCSRMAAAAHSTKSYDTRRVACETDIVALLDNLGGVVEFAVLKGVYHLHYAPHRDKRRRRVRTRDESASQFLRRMEDAGRIKCLYDSEGIVVSVTLREDHGG